MRGLRALNLVLAGLAVLAPMAHVLEMPNKLMLDGALWLAVQQHLYRGWGPFLGAPVELGVLVTTVLLARHRRGPARRATGIAVAAYGGMLAAFFLLNSPVNTALNGWTAATLPPDWGAYRIKWETGHAIAAVLALAGLGLLLWVRERESAATSPRPPR